jgi:aldose 1-epimerase
MTPPAALSNKMGSRTDKSTFGSLADGPDEDLYTLTNANGLVAKIITYGALLTQLHVPDAYGHLSDIVLGFDDLTGYLGKHPYFGATIGRVANRIAEAEFTLDGQQYTLARNDGPHSLHGGAKGFDKVMWEIQEESGENTNGPAVSFAYLSPDGEEGYPGNVSVSVRYALTNSNELEIRYTATTDKATPVNLTNHSYFNLAGTGDILGHQLLIAADGYTPVDETLIPTGEIKPVKDTPMDFTQPMAIGSRIGQIEGGAPGYDHNYVLNNGGQDMALAARVVDPQSGRVLEVHTSAPGIQFYSGNFLDGTLVGKGGQVYQKHSGFCLETQHFPDAVHHPNFPSIILRPGSTYQYTALYKFGAEQPLGSA